MSLISASSAARPRHAVLADQLRCNSGQWAAYESRDHCVILAGPGSGKTKTLTLKMARVLAEDVFPPRGVACITYNNQCARELKNKLAALGIQDGKRAVIGTLHSFCLQHIIRPYAHLTELAVRLPITVANPDEVTAIKQQAMGQAVSADQRWDMRYDNYRKLYLDRQSTDWFERDEEAVAAITAYESILSERGLVDFDGMVLLGLQLVKKNWVCKALAARFPVLVVDEYQDLGLALHEIVSILCFTAGIRLIAVGDPDQSIYGFIGAQPDLLGQLAQRDEVQTIRLSLNYRCGSEIIKASQAALETTRSYQSKSETPGVVYFKTCPSGLVEQANFVCQSIIPQALQRRRGRKIGDIAVLYLDRNDGDKIAAAVSQTGWKYLRVDGNNPYQPSPVTYWLEDCAAWCAGAWETGKIRLTDLCDQWARFNEKHQSERRRLATQARMVRFLYDNRGANTPCCEWLTRFLAAGLQDVLDHEPRLRDDRSKVGQLLKVTSPEEALAGFTVAFFGGQGGSPEHLTLTTLHSAKGLEYDVVIMVGLEDGRIPYFNATEIQRSESRRLFYVGLTRARHEVHLVTSGWYKNRFGRKFRKGRSRYIDEVERELDSESALT